MMNLYAALQWVHFDFAQYPGGARKITGYMKYDTPLAKSLTAANAGGLLPLLVLFNPIRKPLLNQQTSSSGVITDD